LRCLPAPVAETVSLDLLSKWPAEEHDVICTCLEFAGERGSAYAQQTLEAPERYPKEVIARALALHGAKMPELVGQLLKPSTEEEVQCRAIEVLGQEATPYARKLLSAWRDAPATVLVRCFQVTKESEESKRAAQEMVEQFGTIPVQLRPAALRSAPDSDLRRRLAEEVLANWERRDRRLVTSAMTAFWNDPATAAPACRQILKKVQRELPHQSPRRRWKYDGHISKALANPCCEEEARRAAGQILSAPKSRASPTLRKVAQATLDGSHMPWSNAFAKQADAS
jgi:hypothetical protein